jgi:hypothetical protein
MDGNNIAEVPSNSLLRLGVISALKMEAMGSFETVITTDETILCHNERGHNLNLNMIFHENSLQINIVEVPL